MAIPQKLLECFCSPDNGVGLLLQHRVVSSCNVWDLQATITSRPFCFWESTAEIPTAETSMFRKVSAFGSYRASFRLLALLRTHFLAPLLQCFHGQSHRGRGLTSWQLGLPLVELHLSMHEIGLPWLVNETLASSCHSTETEKSGIHS